MNDNILLLNGKKLFINGKNWNYTIIQICEELGISIPRFCYHRELSIVGNCRMCMVELKNSVKPVIACATSLSKNMHIFTNSELVKIARGNVLEFLLVNHPLDCPICDQGGECDLQDQAFLYGSDKSRFNEYKRSVEDKNFGPVIKTVMSRCIHCTRCVRYAEEIVGVFSIGTMGRGKETEISTYNNSILHHEMIGNIADICPVGALLIKPTAFKARTWDLENLDILDIFDSLVSTASMGVKGNELIRVLPRKNDNLNREWITDRIRFFYEGAKLNRLLYPLINISNKIVHASLLFSCNIYINKLYNSYTNKFASLSLIGEELNYYDSFLISHFSNTLNIFSSYTDYLKKYVSPDIRKNWLLNSNISNFIKNNNLLFINVNLKYECAVLNSLLYKNINEYNDQKVYYIGSLFKNSYNFEHIGISSSTLKNIQKGQHFFCNILLKNNINLIESNTQPLFNNTLNYYLDTINKYVKNIKTSYIPSNSTEINLLELGLQNTLEYEDIKDKKFNIVHFFGNSNFINFFLNDTSYKVYFSHHMPDKNIENLNMLLPILNFHEWSPTTKGPNSKIWLNNQLISQVLFDHVTTDAGKPENYHSYLNLFLFYFDKNNHNFLKTFSSDIDNFLKYIEFNNKYNNTYVSSFDIDIVFNTFISYIISREVSSIVYYKSNAYAKNSATISSIYENNSIVINNIFNI